MNSEFAIALHIVGFLTAHPNKLPSSALMAKSFGTSPVVLRRVLAKLNQSGLVETKRGANGGSQLAKPAKKINLKQVFESLHTDNEIFTRHPEGPEVISKILGGYINTFYSDAEQSLLKHLASISVADMDAEVRPKIIKALGCV